MNKSSLLTIGRKLRGNDQYLISVTDLEPAGLIVTAYNQIDSKEYALPISERELATCGYTRSKEGPMSLTSLLESMELVDKGAAAGWVLQSSNEGISKNNRTPTADEIDQIMSSPMSSSSDSINDVLVKGLVELCKVKPVGLEAVEWLGQYLLQNNPNKPKVVDPDEQ